MGSEVFRCFWVLFPGFDMFPDVVQRFSVRMCFRCCSEFSRC